MSTPRKLTMAQAIAEAIGQEMERDPTVFVMGEDIGKYGGIFGATGGLLDKFGPERIMDTPISETAFIGTATGAAAAGLRPIAELMFVDFFGVCMDQIYNHLAKNTYMAGGHLKLPVVLTTAIGGGYSDAAQHSQCLYATFAHMPGLKVVVPSNAYDAKGLMTQAIRDDNPVMFMYHKGIMGLPWMAFYEGSSNEVPEEQYTIPFGQAKVVRAGEDVTIVTLSQMVQKSAAGGRGAGQAGHQRGGAGPAHPGAAGPQCGAQVGGQDRPPAGGRRGLPELRPHRRDRGHRGGEPGHDRAEGAGPPPGRAGRADSLQPATGAVRHSAGQGHRGRGAGADEGPRDRGAGRMTEVTLNEPSMAGCRCRRSRRWWTSGWSSPVTRCRPGRPLANVVLVKSSLEVTAPSAGRIAQILVPAGSTFARGKPIATLEAI